MFEKVLMKPPLNLVDHLVNPLFKVYLLVFLFMSLKLHKYYKTLLYIERQPFRAPLYNFKRQSHKMLNTLKQLVGCQPTNCLSVFDHSARLVFRGLKYVFFTFPNILNKTAIVKSAFSKAATTCVLPRICRSFWNTFICG